jgi:glycerol-3-phosphate O-acyltransferase
MYQPGTSAEEAFEALVGILERLGAVERGAGTLRPGPSRDILDFLAGLLVPFLAGYRMTVEAAIDLLGSPTRRPVTRRKLVAAALEKGRKQIERGELPHQEAVSKATVENAVEWLILGQFLRETPEGDLRTGSDLQALRAIVDRMNPLLRA